MAYAPHNNQDFAYGKNVPLLVGQFVEADRGHLFEYAERPAGLAEGFAPDAQHMVYVGAGNTFRFARVLKTVAHVIVDVANDGQPVWERWALKRHEAYQTDWARADRADALRATQIRIDA